METETEWWRNPLAEDIHETLRRKENTLLPYLSQSPQLQLRRYIVDWLAIICDKFKVCRTAHHLAVYLLDYFMDKFDIDVSQLFLVALGSLLVAAKFEEKEVTIPKAPDFLSTVTPQYSLDMYLQMELQLCIAFKWQIGLPTPAHFIEYYATIFVSETDEHAGKPIKELMSKAVFYMDKYVDYFMEISLQDEKFRQFRPSVIAASCIASSRICLHISPPWSRDLEKVTRYNWDIIDPCIQHMLRIHQKDEQASRKSTASSEMESPVSYKANITYVPETPPPEGTVSKQNMHHNQISMGALN